MFDVKGDNRHPSRPKRVKKEFNILEFIDSKEGKIFLIAVIVIMIGIIIGYHIYNNNKKDFNYLKIDKSKNLVYTLYEKQNDDSDNTVTEVPAININSSDADKVNSEIVEDMSSFLSKKNNAATYEASLNGVVLSVVLKLVDHNTDYKPEIKFKTYNFNLETKKLLTSDEILKIYNVDENTVAYSIQEQFKKFYEQEKKEEYIDYRECDYNCYLEWRGVSNYMDNIHYYVDNGKLCVYKEFSVYSIYGEEKFFKEDDFLFYITE